MPKTFSRAFARRFGLAPRAYRQRGTLHARDPLPAHTAKTSSAGDYALSTTRIQYLRPQHIAAHRHTGYYEELGADLWADLTEDIEGRGLTVQRYLGVGWDPPSDHARFDAAATVAGDFTPSGRLTKLDVPAGPYALTSHVGPYLSLTDAMMEIVQAVMALDGYVVVGSPVVEVYHTDFVDDRRPTNLTDIYMLVTESN